MDEFEARYKKLNTSQKQAVDCIDGPVMVVAGPGTGKTELLSMRVAAILSKTDTLPDAILCLTFTESGANAMRNRLLDIIGADAYKVAIHTFHSFGSEVINQHRQFFYNGAEFRPADDVSTYEILNEILEELPFSNPLASKLNGEYTYLADIKTSISELKKSGLTSDELLKVLDSNDEAMDNFEQALGEIFSERIHKTTISKLQPLMMTMASHPYTSLPSGITPLVNTMALSLAHALDVAADTESTKPITNWKNTWLTKNDKNEFIFKDRMRHEKLRAVSYVYFQYLNRMQEAELYDFDDMVLRVVHALEVFPELRYNLQEKYQYIMVDEFQDTNLAQARILTSLTALETGDAPNIMVVGDDDQAIYSFQGAEVRNVMHFRQQYEGTTLIVLTNNYRSAERILTQSRNVIVNGQDRLENYIPELDKTLTPHKKSPHNLVELTEYAESSDERADIVNRIHAQISDGVLASEIAVLTRKHSELEALLPYFKHKNIPVNYERRDNVLEHEVIRHLTLLATIIMLLAENRLAEANELLPELLAYEAWKIAPDAIWKLSLAAHNNHSTWLEQMSLQPNFVPLHTWLITMAQQSLLQHGDAMLDALLGNAELSDVSTQYVSPLYGYYFRDEVRHNNFESYLSSLEALRTIRTKLRDYKPNQALSLADYVEFVELQQQYGTTIVSVRAPSEEAIAAVNLMTTHKSKGLEFDHVYLVGATDSTWGEKARSRSRLISYPENLPLSPSGDSLDERLRLFFVAMTRARHSLYISFSALSDNGKTQLPASFLVNDHWHINKHTAKKSALDTAEQLRREWYTPYVSMPHTTMASLLAPTLQRYKLSATHLNAFLDVSRGGPQHFLLSNLLRFPQAMSPNAAYGSAIHRTLQRAQAHFQATGMRRPIEDILGDFEANLGAMHMNQRDTAHYSERGIVALSAFLQERYNDFLADDIAELSFSGQQSRVGTAHLTGALDVIRLDPINKTIVVTDYKTGAPSTSWKAKTPHEKTKLHKYRQQLMFYKLLVEHSRDFSGYTVTEGKLLFVEPSKSGTIHELSLQFTPEEMRHFRRLVLAVWQRIVALDLPVTTQFSTDHAGIIAFETWLLDETI